METHSPGKDTNRAKYTYTRITREESETLGADWIHCVHVMLHAPLVTTVHLFDNPNNEIKHTIMVSLTSNPEGSPTQWGEGGGRVFKRFNYRLMSIEHNRRCRL